MLLLLLFQAGGDASRELSGAEFEAFAMARAIALPLVTPIRLAARHKGLFYVPHM